MPMRKVAQVVLAAVVSIGAFSIASAATDARVYPLNDHGRLILAVDDTWNEELKPAPQGGPKSLWFTPKSGPSFNIMITPIIPRAAMDDAKLREFVAGVAQNLQAQAVEKELAVRELKGANGHGYYVKATDKAPAPGEWKNLLQGMMKVGDVAVAFTILTNDGQESVARLALEMVRQAAYRAAGQPS